MYQLFSDEDYHVEDLDKVQMEDICYEAGKVLDGIDYSDESRTVKTLLDKVIIKEGG